MTGGDLELNFLDLWTTAELPGQGRDTGGGYALAESFTPGRVGGLSCLECGRGVGEKAVLA